MSSNNSSYYWSNTSPDFNTEALTFHAYLTSEFSVNMFDAFTNN